jgi:hypothetical protein
MRNVTPSIAGEPDVEDRLRAILDESAESLEPITPEDAVEMYLEDRQRDCSAATVKGHRSRLGFFVEWCEAQEIENMNNLSARDLHDFQV